jgi:hypothetical protein
MNLKATESVNAEEETVLRSVQPVQRNNTVTSQTAFNFNHMSEEDYFNQKDLLSAIR